MPFRHVLLALLVVAIWGFNFVVIKMSVDAMPPLFAASLRFFCAAVPAVFFVKPPKAPFWLVVTFGLFFGFALYSFLNLSLYLGMPAGLASLVLQVQAFFTMFFAFFMLKERPRLQQIVGALVAFGGIGVIAMERMQATSLTPLLLTVAAAAAWGVANVLTKKAGRVNPVALTVWGALAAPLPLLVLSYFVEGPEAIGHAVVNFGWDDAALIAFLAYPATTMCGIIWAWLLGRHPASTVASFTLLVPVFGLVSGALVLGETITTIEIVGAGLVLTGLMITVLRRRPNAVVEIAAE